MLTTEDALRAPSIWLRLWAKRVRIVMFVFCAIVIGYFSWQINVGNWGKISFWTWAFINIVAWGWETWHVLRPYPALVVTSESKVQKRYRSRVYIFCFVIFANFGLTLSVAYSTLDH